MGVWPYDHHFQRDFQPFTLVGVTAPNPADVEVAIKKLKSLDERDRRLKRVDAWVRLVIWEDLTTKCRTPHVNVSSDLLRLLRANVQGFGKRRKVEFSAYVIDYNSNLIDFQLGDDPWPTLIEAPTELKALSRPGSP